MNESYDLNRDVDEEHRVVKNYSIKLAKYFLLTLKDKEAAAVDKDKNTQRERERENEKIERVIYVGAT